MNKQDWALKLIGPHTRHDKKAGPVINFPRAAKLLKAEHARSVRIVKRHMGAYQRQREVEKVQSKRDVLAGSILACVGLLAALQRGRGGKG